MGCRGGQAWDYCVPSGVAAATLPQRSELNAEWLVIPVDQREAVTSDDVISISSVNDLPPARFATTTTTAATAPVPVARTPRMPGAVPAVPMAGNNMLYTGSTVPVMQAIPAVPVVPMTGTMSPMGGGNGFLSGGIPLGAPAQQPATDGWSNSFGQSQRWQDFGGVAPAPAYRENHFGR